MNETSKFINALTGISKTLNVAKNVIPIYKDTKPLIDIIKKKIPNLKHKDILPSLKKTSEKPKKTITTSNNPQFFI